MNMPQNPFKAALKAGEKQIGLWVSLSSNYAAEVVASAGFDWLCVDTEHAPGDHMTVLGQLQAIAPHTSCIMRPPWNDTVMIKRYLDMGAPGLLLPMVQTAEEAQAAVAATRYPPKGVRGVAGSMRGNQFGRYSDYNDRVDDETVVIVQIESRAAMARSVEIGTVEGVDGVFFGPADISADMGLMGQTMHDDVWAAIRAAAKPLMERGVPVGTLVLDPAFGAQLLDEGFTFVAVGTDLGLLARATDNLLADVKGRLKG